MAGLSLEPQAKADHRMRLEATCRPSSASHKRDAISRVKRFQRMKTIGGIVTQDNGEKSCVNLEAGFPSGQRLNVGTST
jgi:hypothetical protein